MSINSRTWVSNTALSVGLLFSVGCAAGKLEEAESNRICDQTGCHAPGSPAVTPNNVPSGAVPGSDGGTSSTSNDTCQPGQPIAQRIVRLNFSQIIAGTQALLGADALSGVPLDSPSKREFQALLVEGDLIDSQVLQKTVSYAEAAAGKLSAPGSFAKRANCPNGQATDDCAKTYLASFAEQSYRRPLSEEEKASLVSLYTDVRGLGSSVEEASQQAIEGILIAPGSLYRTELGAPSSGDSETPLASYETASLLSYFLTNGPPDAQLLDAAKGGKLASEENVRAQVDRLIATDAAVANLKQVMMSYFRLGDIDTTVKDPALFPDFTLGMRNSMYTETGMFLENTLWKGKVSEMMTSRQTNIDENLAKLYGIQYPQGKSGFVPYVFPDGQRAGLLGQGSILSIRSRPDRTSVVSRGLFVNSTILCLNRPPEPPDSIKSQITSQLNDKAQTEREKSDYRRSTSPCLNCHKSFDPYGLVLETFDAIGHYQSRYPGDKPIDTSAILPDGAGGGNVSGETDFVERVASNGVFSRCLVTNLTKYALAEGAVAATDCSVHEAQARFQKTDGTFASLVREVALSKTLSVRAVGGNQ